MSEVDELQRKVFAHPTDLKWRLELGSALYRHGDYDEAISELSRAKLSPLPSVRWPAMQVLVDAYEAKGMKDLAASIKDILLKERGQK